MDLLQNIITYSIIGITVSIITSYLYKSSTKHIPTKNEGKVVLKLSSLFIYIGIIGGFIFIALTLSFFSANELAAFIFIPFIILSLLLVLAGINKKVIFNEERVKVINSFGKEKEVSWQEIISVDFGNVSQELVLKTSNQQVRIHMMFKGFVTLIEMLKQQLPEDTYKDAILKLNKINNTSNN